MSAKWDRILPLLFHEAARFPVSCQTKSEEKYYDGDVGKVGSYPSVTLPRSHKVPCVLTD